MYNHLGCYIEQILSKAGVMNVAGTKADWPNETINLNSLLLQIRDEVTPHWYAFGVSVGVPREIMDSWNDYPPDQCIVEVLDYWLAHYHRPLTWVNVVHVLKEIKLHSLARNIIQTCIQGMPATIQQQYHIWIYCTVLA